MSVASNGTKGSGDSGYSCAKGAWDGATISDDDRYVVFSSMASNLDPRDVNGSLLSDIYVRDRRTGNTRLVSLTSDVALPLAPDGVTCPGVTSSTTRAFPIGASTPHISGDGRFVAFADDRPLTEDDEDDLLHDVFVADLRTGTTELISVSTSGTSPPVDHPPVHVTKPGPTLGISGNGRYVVFLSTSHDLDEEFVREPGPFDDTVDNLLKCQSGPEPPCETQVFVHDRKFDTTKMISLSPSGVPADADTFRPSISDNGRYIVFDSFATNLTPDDPAPQACTNITGNGRCGDVFLHDTKTGKTELVSVDSVEQRGQSEKSLLYTSGTVVTPNGRYVAFGGDAELVPGGGGLLSSATYVRDRKMGRTENVAVTSAGEILETAGDPVISDNGRYVYFVGRLSAGSEGCSGAQACSGRLRHDRWTGQTDWIWIYHVRGSHGTSMGSSGRVFLENTPGAFHDPLVEQDDAAGETHDLFLRDLDVESIGIGGVGTLGSNDPVSAPGGRRFVKDGIVWLKDRGDDAPSGLDAAEIVAGRLVYRPELNNLFARIDVEHLGSLLSATGYSSPSGSPLLYGVDIRVGPNHYQVRISGQLQPRFGLFRCATSGCTEVAELKGGFGTIGEAVVAAIPVSALGLQRGGEITEIRVFAGLGSYITGPTRVLDEIAVDSR